MKLKDLLNVVPIQGDIKIVAFDVNEREERSFTIATYEYDNLYDWLNIMISKIPTWCLERNVREIYTNNGYVCVELVPIEEGETI